MAQVTILHSKNVTVADGTDTTVVRPSDWNSGHAATLAFDSTDLIKWVAAGGSSASKGSLVFQNSNGLTFGASTDANGITITANNQEISAMGVSNIGNTIGNTQTTMGQYILSGGNNVTLSQVTGAAGATCGISVPSFSSFVGGSNITLTSAGSTVTINAPNFSILAAGANVTLSTAGSTISINAAQSYATASYFEPQPLLNSSLLSIGQNTLRFIPFSTPTPLNVLRVNMLASANCGTQTSASCQVGLTHDIALYSRVASNSQSLGSFWSTRITGRQSFNSNVSWLIEWNGGTTSSAGANLSSAWTGLKLLAIPANTSLPAGDFWLAVKQSTSNVNGGTALSISLVCLTGPNTAPGLPGAGPVSTLNLRGQHIAGSYSVTTAGFPTNVNLTDVNIHASFLQPYFNINGFTV
jgi:hypothetical protein